MVFKDYQKDGKIHVNDTSFDIRFESDKLIDGKKYIMISAEAGAEVNGVAVNIED